MTITMHAILLLIALACMGVSALNLFPGPRINWFSASCAFVIASWIFG